MNANRPIVNIAGSEMRPTGAAPISTVTIASSQIRSEKMLQQPAGGSQKSNATATGSPMELDTTESPEPCSMDTNSKENLCTQYDNLSNSSQESPDFGYYSGSSKDFQSQSHPAGGGDGYPFFQSPQQNLKVIQKNQRSRQRELKRLDITKHQRNVFHQPTVTVVNHQVHNYHISPQRDLEQPVMPQWLRPVMDHCPEIIQTLNMGILIPYLLQNGLLAPSESQQLDTLGTPRKQAQHFLINVLPTKGEEGLKRFLKCLKEETDHSGHQYLFRLLGSSRF